MRERPILFSGPMVRAILDGRKTQTRRVVRPPRHLDLHPPDHFTVDPHRRLLVHWDTDQAEYVPLTCPYGATGDRLWVRETWWQFEDDRSMMAYRADGEMPQHVTGERWRPSIHMPRWASRLTLEVKSIRVERVQEIGPMDVQAEGVLPADYPNGTYVAEFGWETKQFGRLWDSINAKRGYGWDTNPWVWVIEFARVEP